MSQYVLEWSKSKNALRVKTIEDALSQKQTLFMCNVASDFVTLMVGSYDVCEQMMQTHKPRLCDRQEAPNIMTMLGKTLAKLDTQELNDLVRQVGPIELVQKS